MKLASFEWRGGRTFGVLVEECLLTPSRLVAEQVVPVQDSERREILLGMKALEVALAGGEAALSALEAFVDHAAQKFATGRMEWLAKRWALPVAEVRMLPPVRPSKVVCVGLNYRAHASEVNRNVESVPVLFARFPQTLVGDKEPVRVPEFADSLDYEGELAVIIGEGGRYISRTDAMRHVAGYAVFNDLSVRSYQRRTHQWMPGKNFDGTGPLGPCLVLTREVPDPHGLNLRTTVNGEIMQSANTKDMIFDIPYLIEDISRFTTLLPGDVIATGTPDGVGVARTPPRFLRPGEMVRVEIDGVGALQNPIVSDHT